MSKSETSNYQTLADFARLVGVDRTTVLAWVRSGKIRSRKKNNSKRHHKLSQYYFLHYSLKNHGLIKPYPKYSTNWSKTEIYILQNWTGSNAQLAKAIGRSKNAVAIKRCRLNKERNCHE